MAFFSAGLGFLRAIWPVFPVFRIPQQHYYILESLLFVWKEGDESDRVLI